MISLIQLEYIVTLANVGQFSLAAEKCFVTQPTLSMQIKKLENDLGVKIFDRSKQPIVPTDIGNTIIAQARLVLAEANKIEELIKDGKQKIEGNLNIGIIPSVAPYLLSLFIGEFARKYPELNISIQELLTEEILEALAKDEIDVGILSTPLGDSKMNTRLLYHERIMLYCNKDHNLADFNSITLNQIKEGDLWLLSDGHCFRNQAINLCAIRENGLENKLNFSYESASIETLIRLVDMEGGMTLIPELAREQLVAEKKLLAKEIESNPVREISLVTNRLFIKESALNALFESIISSIPMELKSNINGEVVEWK